MSLSLPHVAPTELNPRCDGRAIRMSLLAELVSVLRAGCLNIPPPCPLTVYAEPLHVLVAPLGRHFLSGIVHPGKSSTATEINAASAQHGAFWQKESFDHIVRSAAALEKFRQYIRDNPKNIVAKK